MRLLTAFALCGLASAQTGTLDLAMLGYTANSSGELRPIRGIPASATLGAPVETGLHGVAVRADYALGIDDSGAAILLTAGGRRTLPVAGATEIFLSARGAAAAIWRAAASSVDIVTGLPGSPAVVRSIPLDSAPNLLAVSEDGASVAVLDRSSSGVDTLSWIAGSAAPSVLHRSRRIQSIALLDGAVLVAEPRTVKLVSTSFGPQTVADGLENVISAATSADGARVVIGTGSGRIAIVDRATGLRRTLDCGCTPAALAPLRGNAVFRLNEPGGDPLWILDAGSEEPRLLFVAAPAGGAQ